MNAVDAMGNAEPPRAGRAGWLLATAVLAGSITAWAVVFTGPQLHERLAPLAGGLLPRQLELQAAADAIERLDAPSVLVLVADPEDEAFARYLLYPRPLTEGPVRPRERLAAALAAAPDGALVLLTDPALRDELLQHPPAGGPRLAPTPLLAGAVSLLRIER